MGHGTRSCLALACIAALAACTDALPTGPAAPAPSQGPGALRGLHGEFTRLAAEIPGFGGMYYGPEGRLNVYVAGEATPASVRRALASRAPGEIRALANMSGGGEEIVIQQGDYDFVQLSRMYDGVRPVLGLDGVVYTDIDEASNRIRVAVAPGASTAQIEAAIAAAGVPAEAVRFVTSEPVVPLATLRERVQPFGGGLQLVFPNPMPGFVSLCTLGFNILRDDPGRSVDYFVTNSHCTEERSVVDGTPYYQQPVAVLDPRQLIAREIVDPPFFTDPVNCPYVVFGFVCRYSDAAIARYETARTPVRFGSIYRTEFFGTNTPGSLVIGGSNPRFFDIVEEARFPLGGEILDKVGRTTGWTRGPVVATCIDLGVAGTNIAMLCQDVVQAALAGGDSGSPVFDQIGDSKNAILYGILWGGSGTTYVFSAMENIHFELGSFRTH